MAKVLEGPGMGLMKKWGIHVPHYAVVTSADELAKLGHDLAVEALVEIGAGDAGQELVLGIALGGVADEPLLVAQLMVEIERVLPVEWQDFGLAHACVPRQ